MELETNSPFALQQLVLLLSVSCSTWAHSPWQAHGAQTPTFPAVPLSVTGRSTAQPPRPSAPGQCCPACAPGAGRKRGRHAQGRPRRRPAVNCSAPSGGRAPHPYHTRTPLQLPGPGKLRRLEASWVPPASPFPPRNV